MLNRKARTKTETETILNKINNIDLSTSIIEPQIGGNIDLSTSIIEPQIGGNTDLSTSRIKPQIGGKAADQSVYCEANDLKTIDPYLDGDVQIDSDHLNDFGHCLGPIESTSDYRWPIDSTHIVPNDCTAIISTSVV
eukprot:453735_1